jgi:AcrR family transcriptional regulator
MAPSERREQLLDAALRVIVEQGYEGVSIEAIARAAGVTRPVIYDHFANLGGMLKALIQREERIALDQLAQVLPGPELAGSAEPVALLGSGVRRFLDAVASRPPTWRIILLPLDGTPAIVREHVETNRALILQRLETLVRRGVGDGPAAATLDFELAAQSLMTLAEEAGRRALTDPARFSPERYEAFFISVIGRLRGLEAGA